METLAYPYKPNLLLAVGCTLTFCLLAFGFGTSAVENDRGLIINGLIHFSTTGATILYWSGAVLCGVAILAGAWMLYFALFGRKSVVLSESAILVPTITASMKVDVIPIKSIKAIQLQKVHKYKRLCIYHSNGETSVNREYFQSEVAFYELCAALANKIKKQ